MTVDDCDACQTSGVDPAQLDAFNAAPGPPWKSDYRCGKCSGYGLITLPSTADGGQFMSAQAYQASGLDRCTHPQTIKVNGLPMCTACEFIVSEGLVF